MACDSELYIQVSRRAMHIMHNIPYSRSLMGGPTIIYYALEAVTILLTPRAVRLHPTPFIIFLKREFDPQGHRVESGKASFSMLYKDG